MQDFYIYVPDTSEERYHNEPVCFPLPSHHWAERFQASFCPFPITSLKNEIFPNKIPYPL